LKLLSIPLLCACTSVYAQSATTQMPEGTTDVDVGAVAAIVPRVEGRAAYHVILLPTVTAQWSNGIFAAPGQVGMRLSRNPRWNFGPLLTYGDKPRRADSRGNGAALGVEAGGFLSYNLLYNLNLSSQLLYGGGSNDRGLRFTASAGTWMRLTPHQTLGFGTGVTAGNASYMDSFFGVTAQPERPGRTTTYHPGAGLKNVFANVNWTIELSTKYSLNAGLVESHLLKEAAASPLVIQKNNYSVYTRLAYHW
jgi:outer membrane protein